MAGDPHFESWKTPDLESFTEISLRFLGNRGGGMNILLRTYRGYLTAHTIGCNPVEGEKGTFVLRKRNIFYLHTVFHMEISKIARKRLERISMVG